MRALLVQDYIDLQSKYNELKQSIRALEPQPEMPGISARDFFREHCSENPRAL